VLVNRIYDAADAAQARYPEIEILKAPYLDDHPLVLDTLLERVREMLVGQNLMNCAMCKYREQVLGFEAEVGLRQESHHHHVEGIGGGLENCPCGGDCDGSCRDEAFCRRHGLPWTPLHTHGHEDDHAHPHTHAPDHHALAVGRPALASFATARHPHEHAHGHDDHHHHPYPQAAHPHGPVTLPKVQGRRAREEQE
jgi:sirohydrochlorin cobaltochelatase